MISGDVPPEAQSAAREYYEDYKSFVGKLREVHASGTSIPETEEDILRDTAIEMADSRVHLLGGYVTSKAERTGALISSLFFHKIFSDAYKRGMLASINASGFDIGQLPPEEQQSIEAMARLEDTRATTIGSSALIASIMMSPDQAFSRVLGQQTP